MSLSSLEWWLPLLPQHFTILCHWPNWDPQDDALECLSAALIPGMQQGLPTSIFADKALSPFLRDGLQGTSIPSVTKNIWLTKDKFQPLFKAMWSFLKVVGVMDYKTKKRGSRRNGTGTEEWIEAIWLWPWKHIDLNISWLLMHVLSMSYLTKLSLLFFRDKMGSKHLFCRTAKNTWGKAYKASTTINTGAKNP